MKHKSFAVLLLVIMLLTSSGSALALKKNSVSSLVTSPLVNGDFEQGPNVGWIELYLDREVFWPAADLPVPPHSGNWAVWMGGAYDGEFLIHQTLTLPNSAFFRLFYWSQSTGPCSTSNRVWVKIHENPGDPFTFLDTWELCAENNSNTNGWRVLDLDVSAFGGRTVEIEIDVRTGQYMSNFFVDDTSIYTFADVSYDYWAQDFIHRLFNAGITGGCGTNPRNYCPEGTVTRDQMSVFLERGIHGSTYNPPAVGGSTGFDDVQLDYWSGAWIKQLAADGITDGCGSGNYCPASPVTRAQMAVFLLRSKYGASYSPPAVGDSTGFGDVHIDYWAAAWIKQLVAEGITAGCGNGNYCPELPVTRAQMAVFLVRTFNLP